MNTFDADVDAMIDAAKARLDVIAHTWLIKIGDYLAVKTPGPGNQHEDFKGFVRTPYVATGILRMGFNWTNAEPPTETSDFGKLDAPFDESIGADLAREKLAGQLSEFTLTGELWLYNTIAYAMFVHEGWHTHQDIGARPFMTQTRVQAEFLLQEAIAETA